MAGGCFDLPFMDDEQTGKLVDDGCSVDDVEKALAALPLVP